MEIGYSSTVIGNLTPPPFLGILFISYFNFVVSIDDMFFRQLGSMSKFKVSSFHQFYILGPIAIFRVTSKFSLFYELDVTLNMATENTAPVSSLLKKLT